MTPENTTKSPAPMRWYQNPNTDSHVKAFSYNTGNATLFVKFEKGDVYAYDGVTPEDVVAVMWAESAGKAVHGVLKPKYEARRLG